MELGGCDIAHPMLTKTRNERNVGHCAERYQHFAQTMTVGGEEKDQRIRDIIMNRFRRLGV